MNIINNYEQHVETTKKLNMSESFYEAREPHKAAFEEIYNQAKEEGVTISNAKDFLNSLSKEELSSLQHYTLLVDNVKVEDLNDEGAYNLLLHHYEKYDFDKDGLISNGIGKSTSLLPVNMPNEEKEVLVQTLNEMDEKERFLTMLMINPPKFQLMTDGTMSASENDKSMNYEAIMKRINRILNPLPGEYRSSSLTDTMSTFKEMFEKNYEERLDQNEYAKQQNTNDTQLTKAILVNQTT